MNTTNSLATRKTTVKLVDTTAQIQYNYSIHLHKGLKMTTRQKAVSFLMAGLILLLGTVGGVETSPDLLSGDGAYLGLFALVGIAFMALGASYANQAASE
jgi:hypothetical protein